jgi:hypothetical protein
MKTHKLQNDLMVIHNMEDQIAREAAINIIKRIWENEESPYIGGLEITPRYHAWIQRNFYPETIQAKK